MIYKLYAGTKQIDETANEEEIIKTIAECMRKNLMCNYIVTACTEKEDLPYKVIKNVEDYYRYLEDYKNRKKESNKVFVK